MTLVRSFNVGGLRCHTLEGGLQRLDGGAMFGAINIAEPNHTSCQSKFPHNHVQVASRPGCSGLPPLRVQGANTSCILVLNLLLLRSGLADPSALAPATSPL